MKSKMMKRLLVAGALAGALGVTSATQMGTAHASYDEHTSYAGSIDDIDTGDDPAVWSVLTKVAKTKKIRRAVRDLAVVVVTEVTHLLGVEIGMQAPGIDDDRVDVLFDVTDGR